MSTLKEGDPVLVVVRGVVWVNAGLLQWWGSDFGAVIWPSLAFITVRDSWDFSRAPR